MAVRKTRSVRHGEQPRQAAAGLPADMYDDADTFRRRKELKFAEDINNELDEDSEDIEPVFDVGDKDSDFDSEEDADAGGKLAKIAAAERAIKRQIALQRGLDDEDEDEGDDDEQGRSWGSKKSLYYDAEGVDVDFDSDDEAAAEEAEEAARLEQEAAQQILPQDLGLDDVVDNSEDEAENDEATLGAAVKSKEGVHTEHIQRQIGNLSESEKLAAVASDAPELLTLLSNFKANIAEVRGRMAPLLREVKEGGLATEEGISYLEAKHTLMLTYCMNILFYMLLKLEGRPIKDHPVITRLIQIRTYLDKIRPIDKKLQRQVDKLLKAADLAAGNQNGVVYNKDDPLSYRPNPDALISQLEEADPEGGEQIYRPPKLNPVAMDELPREGQLSRDKQKSKAVLRNARSNLLIRELDAELAGAPDELRETQSGMDRISALKELRRLEARAEVEEDNMMRVPLTKEERKRMKALRREGLSGRVMLDDFADVAALIDADTGPKAADPFMQRLRLNQRHGADLAAEQASIPSGDAELPRKADLSERRAKYDAVKARQKLQLSAMEANDAERHAKRPRFEDDFYQEAKAQSEAKKKAKLSRKAPSETAPPLADAVVAAPRKVNKAIESNRGLTPHRRKDIKNPRVKARVKFAKAETRRKGQVQAVKTPEGPYGGEATGIKSRVSKSVRL